MKICLSVPLSFPPFLSTSLPPSLLHSHPLFSTPFLSLLSALLSFLPPFSLPSHISLSSPCPTISSLPALLFSFLPSLPPFFPPFLFPFFSPSPLHGCRYFPLFSSCPIKPTSIDLQQNSFTRQVFIWHAPPLIVAIDILTFFEFELILSRSMYIRVNVRTCQCTYVPMYVRVNVRTFTLLCWVDSKHYEIWMLSDDVHHLYRPSYMYTYVYAYMYMRKSLQFTSQSKSVLSSGSDITQSLLCPYLPLCYVKVIKMMRRYNYERFRHLDPPPRCADDDGHSTDSCCQLFIVR